MRWFHVKTAGTIDIFMCKKTNHIYRNQINSYIWNLQHQYISVRSLDMFIEIRYARMYGRTSAHMF